jgi:hypothetical protein
MSPSIWQPASRHPQPSQVSRWITLKVDTHILCWTPSQPRSRSLIPGQLQGHLVRVNTQHLKCVSLTRDFASLNAKGTLSSGQGYVDMKLWAFLHRAVTESVIGMPLQYYHSQKNKLQLHSNSNLQYMVSLVAVHLHPGSSSRLSTRPGTAAPKTS